ncbi:GNAT family N-acetyltransferase [Actinopolymorpha sp. B9G3]|uniref:GNAT family N-acetyltransferase n=1 Tax=Actinopolymorpha sp. B9G3 TaxID=3158970 RepID=UPI0032D97508
MDVRTLAYDHPHATTLIDELQRWYVEWYGDTDKTPVDPAEFQPPSGLFLVGYLDGRPAGCGGWRIRDTRDPDLCDGDAEIKRMYVVPSARGRGHSRTLLAGIERTARAAGVRRLVLETGALQPEAIGLYESSGYAPIGTFGLHRDEPLSRCFAKVLTAASTPDRRDDPSDRLSQR